MDIKEMVENLKNKLKGNEEEELDIPDDQTRDHHLRSLRRERRIQMEEVEKEQLKNDIAEFKKERMRKHLFGIKDNKDKKKELLEAMANKKRINILKERNQLLSRDSPLDNKKDEFKKKKGILSTDGGMIGRGGIL